MTDARERPEGRWERPGFLAHTRVGRWIARAVSAARTGSGMRELAGELGALLERQTDGPLGVRELCVALCEAMAERRGGRRIDLRFERFPDEFEVTGLWLEFADFDLVIVEERAEAVQQLVILGHELWHMHAGHCHHHTAGAAAAARALAGEPGRDGEAFGPEVSAAIAQGRTPVAARYGSRESDEREAEEFGHRLAAGLRSRMATGRTPSCGDAGTNGDRGRRAADPARQVIEASLGYRGPRR